MRMPYIPVSALLLALILSAFACTGSGDPTGGGESDGGLGRADGAAADAETNVSDSGARDATRSDADTEDAVNDASTTTDAGTGDADTGDAGSDDAGTSICGPACEDVLRCWENESADLNQSNVETEVHRSRMSVFSVSSELDNGGSPWASNVLDGDNQTSWQSNANTTSDEAIVLRLDVARRIRAVEIELGREGSYGFNLFVSPDGVCFGAPVATGTLDGAGTQTIRVEGTGRVGRFIKLAIAAPTDGVAISEMRVLTTAGLWGETYPLAVEGRLYEQAFEADIPSEPGQPVAYAIVQGPAGAEISEDGLLRWTPDDALPAGPVTFEVSATAREPNVTVTKTFDVELLERTVVAVADINPTVGATIAVSGTGTSVDGLTFRIPPSGGQQGEHIEVWSLSSARATTGPDAMGDDDDDPASANAFTPWGTLFVVVGATKPFEVEASDDLIAAVRGSASSAPSLALVALDMPADDKAKTQRPRVNIVGGAECEGVGDIGAERKRVLTRYMDPGVLAQLVAHDGKCYRRDAAPFIFYYWDSDKIGATAIDARATEVLQAAARAKSAMERTGCARLNDAVEILMTPLKGAGGIAPRAGRQLILDRALRSGPELRTTVYHELTHTVHQRTVRWVNEAGYEYDRSPDGRWSIEGLAMFNEDEVEDLDEWSLRYLFDSTPELSRDTVGRGLRAPDSSRPDDPYLQFTFLKALKARKGFDLCQYLDAHVHTPNAYEAVDAVVGGTEQRHLEYAQFAATWLLSELSNQAGRIDDDNFLPDEVPDMKNNAMVSEFNLPGCANKNAALEIPLGTIAGATGARFTCKSPPNAMLDYRISVVTPEEDATLLVFDAAGVPIGDPVRAPDDITITPGQTQFEVVVALDQGPIEAGLGKPKPIRLRIDTRDPIAALKPTTASEDPTDDAHPAILEFSKAGPKARYFNASQAPAGWPETAFYEDDYPEGVQVGNLDWRGDRGDILSWDGPHGRSAPTWIYSNSVNRPSSGYVQMSSNSSLVHRGTKVYAQGRVLYDFGQQTGYVAGAAIRYIVDPTTKVERRYLLAVTAQPDSEVDRLWSLDLDAPAPVLVDAGTVTLPANMRMDNDTRANSYFFNDSATRCASVVPVFAEHDVVRNGETRSESIQSRVVCHVDWLTPSTTLVSFEPEVTGTIELSGTTVFVNDHGSFLDADGQGSTTVPNVTLAIDYVGNREVRMFGRSTGSNAQNIHETYVSGSYGRHSSSSQRQTTYTIGSLTLEDLEQIETYAEAGYTREGLPVSTNSSSESVYHRFAYIDLRYGDVIYVKTRTSGSSQASGDYCARGTSQYTIEASLTDRTRVLGGGQGTSSYDGDLLCPNGDWWEITRNNYVPRPSFTESGSSRIVVSVGLPSSPQLALTDGVLQVLPEIARISRKRRILSIELPDFAAATLPSNLVFGSSSAVQSLVEIDDATSAPKSLLGFNGDKLKLKRLGLF